MIHRKATIKYKGYDPNDLTHGSAKRIYCICDECGRVRWLPMWSYKNLCIICSHKSEKISEETRKKMSDNHADVSGKNNPICGRDRSGKNSGFYGMHHTIESKQKIKENKTNSSGKNNPMYGRKHSNETKQKMKENHANFSGENSVWFGKSHSLESRIKMSCTKREIKSNEFNNFISDDKYCKKWNEKLRILIRDQYNNCDYISGLHKDICNKSKNCDVHHIDYDKEQGCNEKKFKLIPLSHSNHSLTNRNRPFWNRLFQYSLEYDKKYYGEFKMIEPNLIRLLLVKHMI